MRYPFLVIFGACLVGVTTAAWTAAQQPRPISDSTSIDEVLVAVRADLQGDFVVRLVVFARVHDHRISRFRRGDGVFQPREGFSGTDLQLRRDHRFCNVHGKNDRCQHHKFSLCHSAFADPPSCNDAIV